MVSPTSSDDDVRQLLVNILETFTKDILRLIARRYRMDQAYLNEKYMIPYYYMPIVESALQVVTPRIHE